MAQSDIDCYALSADASYKYGQRYFQVVTEMEPLFRQNRVPSLVGYISVNNAYIDTNNILARISLVRKVKRKKG